MFIIGVSMFHLIAFDYGYFLNKHWTNRNVVLRMLKYYDWVRMFLKTNG